MARKTIYMAPFISVSGKWQKNDYKIPVGTGGDGRRYFFGNYRGLTEKASYGFKTLSYAASTDGQIAVRNRFKQAIINADEVLADNVRKAAAVERFKRQTRYKYLRNFVIVEEFNKLN